MYELELLFNEREREMLTYSLNCTILLEKRSLETYQKCDSDSELAKECSDNLCTLKSLYRRFFPHLTDEQLFGGKADEK